jgi:cytoskeleton protein RodZ
MVTASPTYCLEGIGSTKISLSSDRLRSIFFQTEAELQRSAAYQRALASFQTGSGITEGFQDLIKAVGREAIRLALRQLVKQHRATPTPDPFTVNATANTTANPFDASEVPSALEASEAIAPSRQEIVSNSTAFTAASAVLPSAVYTTFPAKATCLQGSLEEARETAFRKIGQELQQARQSKSLSFEQIHSRTWVPIYQLKALEAGQVERLPEDVYVRGFIRRVGDSLGLNGSELAASIPALDPAKTVIPSWARSPEPPCLRPIHLYIGYAALMAGAVGGLTWLSHHPAPPDALDLRVPDESEATWRSPRPGEMRVNPATRMGNTGVMAQPNIAPPENISF